MGCDMHEGVSLGAGGCFIFVPLNKTNVIFKLSFEVWVRTSQRSVFPINSICTHSFQRAPHLKIGTRLLLRTTYSFLFRLTVGDRHQTCCAEH